MNLLPAIDILGGKAVRLAQGHYDRITVYNEDPVEQARCFAEQGATWLHVVDLDGARSGVPANAPAIERIIAETDLSVEVGGGVRTLETMERYVKAGAKRVVMGSALVRDPRLARSAAKAFGGIVSAGVDARGGQVAIEGWCEGAGMPATELVAELSQMGVRHLVYTDIARDGMQTGIDVEAYRAIVAVSGVGVTASGGISSIDDIVALTSIEAMGTGCLEGVITGRAVYEGAFTVPEALAALAAARRGSAGGPSEAGR